MPSKKFSATMVLLLAATGQSASAQNGGAEVYKQRCAMCHSVKPADRPGIGPNLSGVVGRTAASTDYKYSLALKRSGLKWDKATLDAYLTYPGKLVPGTRMVAQVPNAADRAKLIAFLSAPKK
jgi:cytochrome c